MKILETGRPQLILDEFRCKRNIQRMASKAKKYNLLFRPHFKTHQSMVIGHWFKEAGVESITVSSVDMASYFASDGWDDITIAFPLYKGQISALNKLEITTHLRLFVNSTEQIHLLSKNLLKPFHVIIEIDPGYGRSGIHYKNSSKIHEIIKTCHDENLAIFDGFYIHDGRTYQCRSKNEILKQIEPVIDIFKSLKKHYPFAQCIMGDTPSCSVLDSFDPVDVITPGNFVFYDWMQVCIGSCTIDDVALFCHVPIAQRIKSGHKLIIHAGAVHLSKDSILSNGVLSYGQVVNYEAKKIKIIDQTSIISLSQEHGIVNGNVKNLLDEYLWICPIHSCLTANLHNHFLTTTGKIIEKRILS